MSRSLLIKVDQEARPQGSKNVFTTPQGRTVLVESSKNLKRDRAVASKKIAKTAQQMDWTLSDKAIQIELLFLMTRPKSVKRIHHTVKPDTDKLIRYTLDAITDAQIVWKDDSQVTGIVAHKQYGVKPAIYIKITELEDAGQ